MNKFKVIIAIMLASFIGIISNPEMLTASDSVAVNGINNAGIVETVIPEPVIEPTVEEAEEAMPMVAMTDDVYFDYTDVYTPANYIAVGGNTVELAYTASTAENAGAATLAWYYQNGKYIYGHNSWNVFAALYNVGVGGTFTVSYGGVAQDYVVRQVVIYEKIDDYTLRANGADYGMFPIVNARYGGMHYDMALMTCYGTSYGNGDASHRYVVYAEAI